MLDGNMKYYCKKCGCLWRENDDGSWSLFDAEQSPCVSCDNGADGTDFLDIILRWPF